MEELGLVLVVFGLVGVPLALGLCVHVSWPSWPLFAHWMVNLSVNIVHELQICINIFFWRALVDFLRQLIQVADNVESGLNLEEFRGSCEDSLEFLIQRRLFFGQLTEVFVLGYIEKVQMIVVKGARN